MQEPRHRLVVDVAVLEDEAGRDAKDFIYRIGFEAKTRWGTWLEASVKQDQDGANVGRQSANFKLKLDPSSFLAPSL